MGTPGLAAHVEVFNPYHFPKITYESLLRDITFMVYGLTIYQMVMCFNVYISVWKTANTKRAIFWLISLAVYSSFVMVGSFLLSTFNLTEMDDAQSPGEFFTHIVTDITMFLARCGYYIAATLRTRALLQKLHKKILYWFYIMLVICMVDKISLLELSLDYHLNNLASLESPEASAALSSRIRYQSVFSGVFDMVFSNALLVSFLYPIFTSLDMDLASAIKAMIKLGDVQKVIFLAILCIWGLFIAWRLANPALFLAHFSLWLITMNMHFLHLSYFGSKKLLTINTRFHHGEGNVMISILPTTQVYSSAMEKG